MILSCTSQILYLSLLILTWWNPKTSLNHTPPIPYLYSGPLQWLVKNTHYINSSHFKSDSLGPNIANNFVFSFPSAKSVFYYQMSLKLHMPFILWILIETLWLPVFKNKIYHSCPCVFFLSLLLTSTITIIYIYLCMHVCMLSYSSCVSLFVTPWTVAYQISLSMGFPSQ